MLLGIDPLLTGRLLARLDAMGHSDAVVLADAHFPADRLAQRLVEHPGTGTPELLAAIRTVLPLDEEAPLQLMRSADGTVLPVQERLMRAAAVPASRTGFLERHEFYDAAASAYLVVRTGETSTYANALVRKGVVDTTVSR